MCPLRLLSLLTEFSVFMLEGISLKDIKIIWKIKRSGMKTNNTCRWTGMMGIKGRIYRCGSIYAFSKSIMDYGCKTLCRKEDPDYHGFTHYNRPSITKFRIDRVYTKIKIAKMRSFIDHCNAISLDRLSSKT